MKFTFQIGGTNMNSAKLAKRIVDCLSDGYDDEESREEAERICNEESDGCDLTEPVDTEYDSVLVEDEEDLEDVDYDEL